MRFAATILCAGLVACSSPRGLRLIDSKDGSRAPWAESKTSFAPSTAFLAHIRGYGGCKVTLELWRCGSNGDDLINRSSHNIPDRKTYLSHESPIFDTRGRDVVLAERETFYWTSTDYVLRFKPMGPGIYQLRLHSDDGRNESVKFTVKGYR